MVSRTLLGGRGSSSFFESQNPEALTSEIEMAHQIMTEIGALANKLDRLITMRQNVPSNDNGNNTKAFSALNLCAQKISKALEEKKTLASEVDSRTKADSNTGEESTPSHDFRLHH